MKNKFLLAGLCLGLVVGSLYALQIVTDSQINSQDTDGIFDFYLQNHTGQDLSFCKEEGNPTLIIKNGIEIQVTEDDLEATSDWASGITSKSWVQISDDVKGDMYEKHGNFYAQGKGNAQPLSLEQSNVYSVEVVQDNAGNKQLIFKKVGTK